MLIEPISFTGQWLILHPIKSLYREPLRRAASHEIIWTHHFPNPPIGDEFDPWFDTALREFEKGNQLPFVIMCAKSKDIIGSTRYYNIIPEHQRLNIGHSFMSPSHWNTPSYYEAKLLLMRHAFEKLKYRRIEFTTDSRNLPLHNHFKTMGAIAEGVIAEHMKCKDGSIRDTRIFRVLDSEWPDVKQKLNTIVGNQKGQR